MIGLRYIQCLVSKDLVGCRVALEFWKGKRGLYGWQKSSFEILKDTAGFTSRIVTFGYSQKIISCKFCWTGKGLEIGCRLQRKRGSTIKCWLLYCSPSKILGVQYRLGAPFLAVVESGIEVSLEFRNDDRYTSSWAPVALSSSLRTEAGNCWSWITPLEVSFPNPVIVSDSSESGQSHASRFYLDAWWFLLLWTVDFVCSEQMSLSTLSQK